MNVYERNFNRLVKLGIINAKGELQFKEALKIQRKGFMDLNLDYLEKDEQGYVIAMAHNYEQNGDIMADPDMQIRIIPEMHSIEALTFQQDNMGIFQEVYPEPNLVNPKAKKELNAFLETWLKNLIEQGFKHDKDKPTFRIDKSAKGIERRMLETFGMELKKKGWKQVS